MNSYAPVEGSPSPVLPTDSASSNDLQPLSGASSLSSATTLTSETTPVSPFAPDEFERENYYNGLGFRTPLIYRSDYHSTPFPRPSGNAPLVVKSHRSCFGTPLHEVWLVVMPPICRIVQRFGLRSFTVAHARFFTHGSAAGATRGTLGPPVVWISVPPGSTSPETAHAMAQEILAVLHENGVDDTVVEFFEEEQNVPFQLDIRGGGPGAAGAARR